ncbi:MAG: RNA polymerase sigma factor [Flavobacteriaceae bacterium]|nr:RNA polymerase sigma factor [Flavobacteriaceae bacterium]
MQEKYKHINQLITSCKEGKPSAQFEIYKLYYKAMYNTALRIMQDSFEAEDIMQEAFLNAFTKLDTFKGEVPFGAWLKRIVINKSLTQIKKNNRYTEVSLDKVENVLSDNDDQTQTNEMMDYSAIKAKEVVKTIEQLKDNYRVALTLSLIEGYDNEEIAGIMHISNENCRTTISRAKNKLRKLINHQTLVN